MGGGWMCCQVVHPLCCRPKAPEIQKTPSPGPIRIQRSSKVHCAPVRDDWVDPPPPPYDPTPGRGSFPSVSPVSVGTYSQSISIPWKRKERKEETGAELARLDNTAPPSPSRAETKRRKRGRSF